MQIYVYNTSVGIKKFTIVVFLENFPFNKDKPARQDYSFGDGGAAYRPPDGIHAHTRLHQQQGCRNAHVVAPYADDSRRYGAPYAVEDALHGDFQHHEQLRVAVDAQEVAARAIGRFFGHEDGEQLVAVKDEQQRAKRAEHGRHPERRFPCLPYARCLSGGVVLGDESTQSGGEAL